MEAKTLGQTLVEALSGSDIPELLSALGTCSQALTHGQPFGDDLVCVLDACSGLAHHADSRVRQAVADVCGALPHTLSVGFLAELLRDSDYYVNRAADRAIAKRAAAARAAERARGKEAEVGRLLGEIETKHKKAARRLAERAIRHEKECFVRQLHHELVKIVTPLEASLHKIETETKRSVPDRATVAEQAAIAIERLQFLCVMMEAARESTKPIVAGALRTENAAAIVEVARGQLVDRMGADATRLAFDNGVAGGVEVQVDRHLLLQAIQNVLQNAVEAQEGREGAIRIDVTAEVAPRGDEVCLAFRDFGPGMDDEQKSRLFAPFKSSKKGGTGVGLTIARDMVEVANEGVFDVESVVGEGTTITMRLKAPPPAARGGKR